MLNARRRHRLDHTEAKAAATAKDTCSTPGGVIVSITQLLGADHERSEHVLNARRRHRLDHRPLVSPCKLTLCDDGFQASTEEWGDCFPLC